MTKLRRFQRRLITLRGRQDVHALFVRELGQTFGVHRPTTFLFGFERLSGIAGIDDQQQVAGVETFNGCSNSTSEMLCSSIILQALLSEFRAFARVAEVMRNQIEALRLRGAVSGEVDDHCVFRLARVSVRSSERRFQRRRR